MNMAKENEIVLFETEDKEITLNVKVEHSAYYAFVCITSCDKESVILQEGETCDYKWADKEEILAMGDDELLAQTMRKYVI
jgi:hypothetical protein